MLHQLGREGRKDMARKERVSSPRQVLLGRGARDPSQGRGWLPRRAQCCQLSSQPGSTAESSQPRRRAACSQRDTADHCFCSLSQGLL